MSCSVIARAANLNHEIKYLCGNNSAKLHIMEIRSKADAEMSKNEPAEIHRRVMKHRVF
jgi:hypothetical protein